MDKLKSVKLKGSKLHTSTLNKKGQLINAYSPLQNTIDSIGYISDCSTTDNPNIENISNGLGFSLSHPVDMLVQQSYDGGVNLILNDGKTRPKIINSRFSVQEDNTFYITDHIGFKDTNLYNKENLAQETSLIPYVKNILKIKYDGLKDDAGVLKNGIYTFYFKYVDADGNLTQIQGESGLVYVHKGQTNNPSSIRFGLENESTDKAVLFKLSNIDLTYTDVQIYYARIYGNENGRGTEVFKILTPYPVDVSGNCDVIITGSESTIQVSTDEIQLTHADLGAVETQTTFSGMLLQGNVSKIEHDYEELKQMSWRIYPQIYTLNYGDVGSLNSEYQDITYESNNDVKCIYYNTKNLYYRVGYWPEEIYRFGIVYIFEDGLLSPVFDVLGIDFIKAGDNLGSIEELIYNKVNINGNDQYEERLYEPENGQFTDVLNSKGVIRMPKKTVMHYDNGVLTPTPMYVTFNLDRIGGQSYSDHLAAFNKHKIKGYFFVRQTRIPNILCQGLVINHTDKDRGGLPVLIKNNKILGQSFLDDNRFITHDGYFSINDDSTPQSFLAPDAILQTPIFNDIFTSTKCHLSPVYQLSRPIYDDSKGDYLFGTMSNTISDNIFSEAIRITNVPDGSTVLTNGVDYFCGVAGNSSDAIKTADLKYKWDYSLPQDLSQSTSVVRGVWGTYAGLEKDKVLQYGQLCNVYKEGRNKTEWINDSMQAAKSNNKVYYAICDRCEGSVTQVDCFRGDCFISLYTHRMFRNFIDPTYPTNTTIVDPANWKKNYAVRCTGYTGKKSAFNNCHKENEGWYIEPTDIDPSNRVYNQIASKFILDVKKITKGDLKKYKFTDSTLEYVHEGTKNAHKENGGLADDNDEHWQKFDLINGFWRPKKIDDNRDQDDDKPIFLTDVPYGDDTLGDWWKWTYLDIPDPPKETGFALIDFAVTVGNANAHEYIERKSSNINLSDINAVGLGQWITFPICSNMNIAMRDVDFKQASEEALFNSKRSFFPLSQKNKFSKISDSYCINNALKNTVPAQQYTYLPNKVFFKQEFFNRIYYSLIDSATTEANEWKQILSTNFVDYPKEYGSITKIIDNGNNVYVIFEHGIGSIPINVKQDGNVGLGSLQVLDSTYGSMWKDSIISTDVGIFGVDTVAKVIWKLVGEQVNIISNLSISKFLIDNIDMSETTRYPYTGHINVKTHYNKNKQDVIFTYYNDIPYILPDATGIVDIDNEGFGIDSSGNRVIDSNQTPYRLEKFIISLDSEGNWSKLENNINILWKKGKQWSICFNLELNRFTSFYDWIPLESENIDSVFFSFDKNQIDTLFNTEYKIIDFTSQKGVTKLKINSHHVDPSKLGIVNKFVIEKSVTIDTDSNYTSYKCYIKTNTSNPILMRFGSIEKEYNLPINKWVVLYGKWPDKTQQLQINGDNFEICEFTLSQLHTENVFEKEIIPNDSGIFPMDSLSIRDTKNRMLLWKHGQTGIYDNQEKIKPTHWYGNQHEFNFEFVINDQPMQQKIFNNLKLLSNKTSPDKFEFEVVGEGYEWFEFKPIVEWINKQIVPKGESEDYWWIEVLGKKSGDLEDKYPDFPGLFERDRIIHKLPYLKMKHTDKKGTPERPHYKWDNPSGSTYWEQQIDKLDSKTKDGKYTYNCSEPCLVEDDQLNETRIRTEQLGNDIRKYGRIRGNMQYLEDFWDVEIRPIQLTWCYLDDSKSLCKNKLTETRHRDKYIKVKVRYSGEDLAVINGILTLYNESYA